MKTCRYNSITGMLSVLWGNLLRKRNSKENEHDVEVENHEVFIPISIDLQKWIQRYEEAKSERSRSWQRFNALHKRQPFLQETCQVIGWRSHFKMPETMGKQ